MADLPITESVHAPAQRVQLARRRTMSVCAQRIGNEKVERCRLRVGRELLHVEGTSQPRPPVETGALVRIEAEDEMSVAGKVECNSNATSESERRLLVPQVRLSGLDVRALAPDDRHRRVSAMSKDRIAPSSLTVLEDRNVFGRQIGQRLHLGQVRRVNHDHHACHRVALHRFPELGCCPDEFLDRAGMQDLKALPIQLRFHRDPHAVLSPSWSRGGIPPHASSAWELSCGTPRLRR